MREIKITSKTYGDFIALVDDAHYDYISKFTWCVNRIKKTDKFYVRCSHLEGEKDVYLHRLVCQLSRLDIYNYNCDHINGNRLDCRSSNLRAATYSENGMNSRKRENTTSIFKGVSWHKQAHRWISQIQVDGKKIYLGLFDTQTEAAQKFNDAAIVYHGAFAFLNSL